MDPIWFFRTTNQEYVEETLPETAVFRITKARRASVSSNQNH